MKNRLKLFILYVLCINGLQLNAQPEKVMNADGKTDTYKLIESFGYGVEVPDCGHPIKHITQLYDSELEKQVFAFTLHREADDDRCKSMDRQRTEIKTFGVSPESMKGHQGKVHRYKWKFKLDKDFRASPFFCHIHQVTADGGPNSGAPIITLTPRLKSGNEEVMQLHIVTSENKQTIIAEVDLSLFKGTWVEATETILHDRPGWVEMEIKRVSDGKKLLSGKSKNVDLWRDGARFNRPKYGIYRSLNGREYLHDESVLFADIEFIEIADTDKTRRSVQGWNSAAETEQQLVPLFSSPQRVYNIVDFGAVGNNVYDCSSAFEKAIEASNRLPGGTIYIPKGTYKLENPIYLPSNIKLDFAKDAVLVNGPIDEAVFLIHCNNRENIVIDGGRFIGGGVLIQNSENILIRHCDFDSPENIVIRSDKVSRNIIMNDNYFRRAMDNAIAVTCDNSGRIYNVFAENNTFGIVSRNIVNIKTGTHQNGAVEDVWMRNNHSEGYLCETAIRLEQPDNDTTNSQASVLRYNYYENFSNLNVANKGIFIDSSTKGNTPIESIWFRNIQITGLGDILVQNTKRDIYLDNVDSKPIGLPDAAASTVPGAKLEYKKGEIPDFWSIATARSTIARWPDYTQAYYNAWTYVNGYMACAFERLYKNTGDKTYLEYIKRYIDTFIGEDGKFMPVANNKGIVRVPNVCDNMDNMMLGNTVVMLYENYKDERYKKAADHILSCMKSYPRNGDGGFWHGKSTHGQMWIDGIFMGQMFSLRYGRSIGDSEYIYDEAIRQITVYAQKGEQNDSGLYVHGIFEPGHSDKECRWATDENRKSSDVWGEGLGWYALVLVEALETIPSTHKGYNNLKNIYHRLVEGLKNTQDAKTGGWYQVVDKGDRPNNWIETSGTAMFTYAIQQGINLGILDDNKYRQVVMNGYNSIVNHAKINERGLVDIYEACDGVGVQTDYEKYIAYKKSLNAKEAYVGFVWATEIVEREALKRKMK